MESTHGSDGGSSGRGGGESDGGGMMPTPSPRPIPLLATNLDLDTEGYLTRLVDQGWYAGPSGAGIARHKLVVAGGCEPLVL